LYVRRQPCPQTTLTDPHTFWPHYSFLTASLHFW
jgi:hypothetical protein